MKKHLLMCVAVVCAMVAQVPAAIAGPLDPVPALRPLDESNHASARPANLMSFDVVAMWHYAAFELCCAEHATHAAIDDFKYIQNGAGVVTVMSDGYKNYRM